MPASNMKKEEGNLVDLSLFDRPMASGEVDDGFTIYHYLTFKNIVIGLGVVTLLIFLGSVISMQMAVLSASLDLLQKRLENGESKDHQKIIDRAQRSLQRLLDMEYGIEDILREKNYRSYYLINKLLESCSDELELLAMDEFGNTAVVQRIQARIEEIFGPKESPIEEIRLHQFVYSHIQKLRPSFSHRACQLITRISETRPILIPRDVLAKIVEGLVRNAVENTPDQGRIELTVKDNPEGFFKDRL